MKCPHCWKRVAKRPERCPHCDYELTEFHPPKPPDGGRSQRIRKLVIFACAIAVGVGVFARELGLTDTSGPNRLVAKNLAGEGLEALMQGDYTRARAKLDLALKEDELFAEAYLGRAMTGLATADFAGADRDARFAAVLFEDGRIEPRAWGGAASDVASADGLLIARRIECVVAVGQKRALDSTQASRLFQLFTALRRVDTCDDATAILKEWQLHRGAHRVMVDAIAACQPLWPCRRD